MPFEKGPSMHVVRVDRRGKPMCFPEREDLCPLLRSFADHIREPYRVFLERSRTFDPPINAEYPHLLASLRSAVCMWPYARIVP